jgi:G:T/U-mismatch repair DNA glycosylase
MECMVDGALDSRIRNPVYRTELPKFIARRGISKVFFNGNNAYLFYRRGIGEIERRVLPSGSPAYAGMRFEEKLRLWRERLQ